MTRAVLSLGSNLGDRAGHLRAAVAGLGDAVRVVSGVYETAPWGDDDQPPYLNAVVIVADPAAGPREWLERARALEAAEGRVREPGRRFGPRTLDVDVISVWDDGGEPVLTEDPELTLPHPRAHLRAFVLRPWIDIEPYGRLPGRGWLTDLLGAEPVAGDVAGVRARPDVPLQS
ncbi:2-amino-4-hydroxy-6-hydroxymethyldihydropteridine diphosphokinase [Rhizomonospora bruguierae]|uniref:2-amino-4-hydroxy-6- hydroxymethyldihydropteridine diphosphokinase n=1 Tax=Rhizomonospora bruguierae TaxID=1581705 RepID=UPI001BCF90BA|nr:2-amino-4-hydroxy-6-hydroxymethyldihydropteridine diphosphokinase [Micromonospora sp. NBRC 107566]